MAGREKSCKWYFSDQPNGQEVGPNNAMEQSFRRNPYASCKRKHSKLFGCCASQGRARHCQILLQGD